MTQPFPQQVTAHDTTLPTASHCPWHNPSHSKSLSMTQPFPQQVTVHDTTLPQQVTVHDTTLPMASHCPRHNPSHSKSLPMTQSSPWQVTVLDTTQNTHGHTATAVIFLAHSAVTLWSSFAIHKLLRHLTNMKLLLRHGIYTCIYCVN